MLTVKLFTNYGDEGIIALVANYGREYAATLSDRGLDIRGTAGEQTNQYARVPAWKLKADRKAIAEFMAEAKARNYNGFH